MKKKAIWENHVLSVHDNLVLKDDGIYGKLELNNLGKVAVENKHFRYLSPELNVNQLDRTVQSIVAVGLVNSPNLLKKSLNKQEKEKDMPDDLKQSFWNYLDIFSIWMVNTPQD